MTAPLDTTGSAALSPATTTDPSREVAARPRNSRSAVRPASRPASPAAATAPAPAPTEAAAPLAAFGPCDIHWSGRVAPGAIGASTDALRSAPPRTVEPTRHDALPTTFSDGWVDRDWIQDVDLRFALRPLADGTVRTHAELRIGDTVRTIRESAIRPTETLLVDGTMYVDVHDADGSRVLSLVIGPHRDLRLARTTVLDVPEVHPGWCGPPTIRWDATDDHDPPAASTGIPADVDHADQTAHTD